MLQVLNACVVHRSMAMDPEMRFETSEVRPGSMYRVRRALDHREVYVESQLDGDDIDRFPKITSSKFKFVRC